MLDTSQITIAPAERNRLANLLGMVGSSSDNEALTAARLADKFIRERGWTWHQVLNSTARADSFDTIEAMIAFCLHHEDQLNFWEHGFVLGIRGRQLLTVKQLTKLKELVEQLQQRAAA